MRSIFGFILLLLAQISAAQKKVDFTISNAAGCVPLTVVFTDVSSGAGVIKRTWDFGNGSVVSSTPDKPLLTAGLNYFTAKTYMVTLTVLFDDNTEMFMQHPVTVHPKPVADFALSANAGCRPLTVMFTDKSTTSEGVITRWDWDLGAGSGSDKDAQYTYETSDVYYTSLIVYNNFNCKSEHLVKKPVDVYDNAIPAFTIQKQEDCSALQVHFENATTGKGNKTYEWDFGDGNTSTDESPTFTYASAGTHNVTLKVSNGYNCSRITEKSDHILHVGVPKLSAVSAPKEACANSSVNFSASISPALPQALRIVWTFSDGSSYEGSAIKKIFSQAKTYTGTVYAETEDGCKSNMQTFDINIKPMPAVSFTAKQLKCDDPLTLQFTNANVESDYTYKWTYGDGQTSSNAEAVHTYKYASGAIRSVSLKVTDRESQCSSIQTIEKSSTLKPVININSVTPAKGCKPLLVTAISDAQNAEVKNYIWDFGDGTKSSRASQELYLYNTEGIKNISVEMEMHNGCKVKSNSMKIIVTDICEDDGSGNPGSSGDFIFSPGTCADKNTVSFEDQYSSHPNNNTTIVEWDFGDGNKMSQAPVPLSVTHTYAGVGTRDYLVTVTRKNMLTGALSTSQKNISIIDEKPDFTIDKNAACTRLKIAFVPQNMQSRYIKSYTWDFGNNKSITKTNSNYLANFDGGTTYQYDMPGEYNASLTIIDKFNCSYPYQLPQSIIIKGPIANFKVNDALSCKEENFTKTLNDLTLPNSGVPISEWDWYMWPTGAAVPAKPTMSFDASSTMMGGSLDMHFSNISKTYTTYSIKLIVKDAVGCESAPATKSAVVKSFWPVAAFSSKDTLQCNRYDVAFINASSGRSLKYTWDYGDNLTAASKVSHTHSYAGDGIHTVALAVGETEMPSCKDELTKVDYIKIGKPIADFEVGDTRDCVPIAVSFYNKSKYANAYNWNFDDGSTDSKEENPLGHIYGAGREYKVSLEVTGANSCTAKKTIPIKIKGSSGKLNYNNFSGCVPFTFRPFVTGTNIDSVNWDFRDGSIVREKFNEKPIAYTFANAGKYLPNVIIKSPEGCLQVLKAMDSVVVDDVKARFSQDENSLCGAGTIAFSNQSDVQPFSSIAFTEWLVNDKVMSNEANPKIFFEPGIYNVRLKATSSAGECSNTSENTQIVIHENPGVAIDGKEIVCLVKNETALQYKMKLTGDVPVTAYEWKLDDVVVGNNAALSKDYRETGAHLIKLTATSADDCPVTVTREVVIDSVTASFSIKNPESCINGNVIEFQNTSTAASPVAYIWEFGDDHKVFSENATHSYDKADTYEVTLNAKTAYCSAMATGSSKVTIYGIPDIVINGKADVCVQADAVFNAIAHANDDAIATYKWYVDGSEINGAVADKLTYVFPQAKTYEIKSTVFTKHNCSASVSVPHLVKVNALPAPVMEDEIAVCKGTAVTLKSNGGARYKWFAIDPAFETEFSTVPSISVTPTMNVRYYVNVVDELGCMAKDSTEVTVQEPISISIRENIGVCLGGHTQLFAEGNAKQFVWDNIPGLNDYTIANPVASPVTTTTYRVKGVSNNLCPDASAEVTVKVLANAAVDIGEDLTMRAGALTTLHVNSANDLASYEWLPQKGLSCYDCAQPILKADQDIQYRLVAYTKEGCAATDSINIKVLCGNAVAMPNAFTPNDDGKNDVFYVMGYGIQQVKSFQIYDRLGKVVFNKTNFPANDKSNGWDGSIRGFNKPQTGTYIYHATLVCNEGKTIQLKGTVILLR